MTALLVGILSLLVTMTLFRRRRPGKNPYPPGPPGHLLIGNLRQFPSSYAWETFAKWGGRYGPLTYVNVAGKDVVVINTHETAMALLDARASIYSDRPRHVMMRELCGLDGATAFMPYGVAHRKHRKLLAQALHPRVVQKDFVPLEEKIIRTFETSLKDTPDEFTRHIKHLFGDILHTITYGTFEDDELYIREVIESKTPLTGKVMTGYAVDFLPWLKYLPEWLPGVQFKRDARAYRRVFDAARTLPFEMVKRKKAAGELVNSCFVSSLLEANDTDEGGLAGERVIAETATTLYNAGSDTMSAVLRTFFLAMTLFPNVQVRARAELERVLGTRFPNTSDQDALPYLGAVLTETLRWHSPAPNAVPHRVTRDDVYDGMFVPAGTVVFVNIWGILHDERHFPDPMTFNPDRWLASSPGYVTLTPECDGVTEKTGSTTIDPWSVAFGYGRRICPGIHVARTGLFLSMARILSSFEIRRKIDPITRMPIVPEAKWTGGSISVPVNFVCDIKPRSLESFDQAEGALSTDMEVDVK